MEMLKQGHLSLKMAYIEEKKMYQAQLITRYMVYEQELLKTAMFVLKDNAKIDQKRAMRRRDTDLERESSQSESDIPVVKKKGYQQIQKTIRKVTNGGRHKARLLTIKEDASSCETSESDFNLNE
jgi:hypothetical protein